MDMVFLMLLWLCIGACVGLIASAAHLQPATRHPFAWLRTLIVGICSAFCGGWLGILILGRPFTIPMALWIAVVSVVCIPWLTHYGKATKQRRGSHQMATSSSVLQEFDDQEFQ